MSTETLLKKDFLEKDVQRLRNLVANKYGEKTRIQVGYSKGEEEHKEGDVWEANNKSWTIKDGIVQTYTKLDEVKSTYRLPFLCPKCHKKMGTHLDKKMYPFHKKCFNCVVEEESIMKIEGTYETYAKEIMKSNARTFIDEAKDFISDFSTEEEGSFITEDGERENWSGSGNKHGIVAKMIEELDELKEKIETI